MHLITQTTQHLPAGVRLVAHLFSPHLVNKLHQLLHREQDHAAVDEAINRCKKLPTSCVCQVGDAGGVDIVEQIEQSLPGGRPEFSPNDL